MSLQLDNTAQFEPIIGDTQQQKITIKSDYLNNKGKFHAFAIALIPFLGTIFAVTIALVSGINSVDIWLLVVMYVLNVIGIEVGFHRYFSHNAFQTKTSVRAGLAILGSMAAQGPVNYWVSNHRRHHQYSDSSGDLHSPHIREDQPLNRWQGLWHAHIGWIFQHELTNTIVYAKDLLRDPLIYKINRLYLWWIVLGLTIPAVLGGLFTLSWTGMFSGLLWGGIVRLFLVQQGTFIVNSVCHVWGSRPFLTSDRSTNNIWLALPSLGGSWHNNHHTFPYSATNRLDWWQVDISGWLIQALGKLGLAWNIRVPSSEVIKAKKNSAISSEI